MLTSVALTFAAIARVSTLSRFCCPTMVESPFVGQIEPTTLGASVSASATSGGAVPVAAGGSRWAGGGMADCLGGGGGGGGSARRAGVLAAATAASGLGCV